MVDQPSDPDPDPDYETLGDDPMNHGLVLRMTEKPLKLFGEPDPKAVEQIRNCLADERAVAGALMANNHLGYSMPIGGVVAYEDAISPTGVGFDIGCGNKAVKTNILVKEIFPAWPIDFTQYEHNSVKLVMREIQKKISFGLGRSNSEPIDHPVLESDTWREVSKVFGDDLWAKACAQLGTVGSGNHYVDLLMDEDGYLWVANHFGSRGLGHTIASGFLAVAAGRDFTDRVPEVEGSVVFSTSTDLGQFYIECMKLAGEYAYAGRDYVADQVLQILGAKSVEEVHNHHNFAWEENGVWVVRKGATPLTTDLAFIGGSMGDVSAIVRERSGKRCSQDYDPTLVGEEALGSAPHGAGRVMSRTAAAGKMRKMWYCNNRNCDFEPFRKSGDNTEYERNCCPNCGLPLRSGRMRDTSTAAINWDNERKKLLEQGIVVLGAGADESPGVYKDLTAVLAAHSNIEVVHTLRPIGVVMAGEDTRDPYKD